VKNFIGKTIITIFVAGVMALLLGFVKAWLGFESMVLVAFAMLLTRLFMQEIQE
jgi:hypothetical protein